MSIAEADDAEEMRAELEAMRQQMKDLLERLKKLLPLHQRRLLCRENEGCTTFPGREPIL